MPGILDYPIGFRGLITLNGHRTAAGAEDRTKNMDTYLVERFDFSRLQFRDQRDGLHLLAGGDLGVVSSEFRFVSLMGKVVAPTAAALEDKVALLNAAFDPELCVDDNPPYGLSPLDFYTPTAQGGYASPVREKFIGRPTAIPATYERRGDGHVVLFAAELICADPSRYLYTAESRVANAGNSFSVSVPNWTTAMGKTVGNPVVTLVLTGAGHASCTLRYTDAAAQQSNLVLNLSGIGAGAHTVVVDMMTGKILLDGAHAANLRSSAVDTFWRPAPGTGTFAVVNTTNLTSATLAYNQARG